ncbi:MAG: S8 family serine peptidase [Chloroflexota bacterium]
MKAKWFNALSVVVILVIAIVPLAGAQGGGVYPVEPLSPPPSAETGEMVNETPAAWFVEFKSAPTANGGSIVNTKADKKNFRDAAKKYGLQFTERYAFDKLWNGMSITVKPGDVNKLSVMPGVKAVYPVFTVQIPETTDAADPELATALAMTGADLAQSDLGYTGTGIKVAVMDTGIDYDHPDLGGCFGSGCRVFTGWDFVGDAFNADTTSPSYNPITSPDPFPDDCNGHGTHVSGIVGANGSAVGVAPGVTFGAYRVFGCEGSTTADIMIAAMERALDDDMDILNMSIGSAFTWPQYPTAQAADLLVSNGMVVVASIGNSGANGLYSAGAPGLGKDVIGVASFDNSHINALTFNVNPPGDGRAVPYLDLATTDSPPTSGNSDEIVHVGRGCSAPLDPYLADPNGKVALIERGLCTFNEKYQRAVAAGATGVIIYNSVTGLFAGGGVVGVPGKFGISISRADGLYIRTLVGSSAAWTDTRINAANPTGGLISSFSSYGLSPDLSLKPDIGAPGGLIRSTYPLELGGFATISGTSMASPHVAGAVALLLEAKPSLQPTEVRGILQNSADPKPWSLNPGIGFLDHVHRQGAGMLDIDDSILSTTTITPAKIATGEGAAGPFVQTLTLKNTGASTVTYDLSFVNALSTGGVITPTFFSSNASVTFSASSVAVSAGGTSTVTATINPATGPVNGQYGGYIVFTPQGGGQVYRVPFAGFVGDYQGIQMLTPTPFNFPALGWTPDGTNFGFASPGDTFTMQGFDVPYILIHFDHQVQVFQVEIRKSNGQRVHPVFSDIFYEEYLPRNSTSTGFFAFAWDGTRLHNNGNDKVKVVPDGEYYFIVKALKANGDANNPAHWETWTSPVMNIDRP